MKLIMVLLCIAATLRPGTALGQAAILLDRPLSAGVLLPPTSVAIDESTFSLVLNPAGLPMSSTSFGYLHEEGDPNRATTRRGDGIYARLFGMNAGDAWGQAVGIGGEWIRPAGGGCSGTPCVSRFSLGYGLGTPAVSAGIALHWYGSAQSHPLDHILTLDLGLLWRPASFFSFGFVAQGVNGAEHDGLVVPRLYQFGLGIRPFAEWLTLSADYAIDDQSGGPGSRLQYLARLSLPQGLDLTAEVGQPVSGITVAHPLVVQFGLRGSFDYVAAELSAAGFTSGAPFAGAGTVAIEGSLAERPSIVGMVRTAQVLDLTDALREPSGLLDLLGLAGTSLTPYSAVELRLHQLASEPSLELLVVKVRGLPGISLARVEGLRTRVAELRAHGKKVLFWLEGGGDTEYYLATSGDRIHALSQAGLEINGLATTHIYLRGLLKKIGVQPEFVKIGAYKSAPEQFTNDAASEPAAEETNALLDDQYNRYVSAIADARHMTSEKVRTLINQGVFTSDQALDVGFLDGLSGSVHALEKPIEALAGHAIFIEPAGPAEHIPTGWDEPARLGLVEVTGDIVPGDGGGLLAGRAAAAERIVKELHRAAEDTSIKAVVLRVESPGGDVAASELIWQAVKELRERKPVVASFGDVAASGGYYIAAGANLIVSEPSTLTGSIGVFAGKADLSGLLNYLGVTTQVFKRGDQADLYSLTRPWTTSERQIVEAMVQRFYDGFLDRVAQGRGLTREQVHAVAQGRVWTGAQAKDHGLVDVLGDLNVALTQARRLGGLPSAAQVAVVGSTGLFSLPEIPKVNAALGRAAGALATGRMGYTGALLSPAAALRELMVLGAQASPEALDAAEPLVRALTEGRPLALAIDLPLAR